MKAMNKLTVCAALVGLLAGCGGTGNLKSDSPAAAGAEAAQAAPVGDARNTAPSQVEAAPADAAAEGEAAEPVSKGRTTKSVELATPHKASDDLKERVLERWALLLAQRGQEAFAYLTPGYRSNKSADTWAKDMSARPITWRELGVHSVTCDTEDACKVSVWSESEVKLSVAQGTNSVFGGHLEDWLRIDGVWYYLPNH